VSGGTPRVATAGVVGPKWPGGVHRRGLPGQWALAHASGCQHSTWLFCCCTVCDQGPAASDSGRGPRKLRVLFVPIAQVTILDTWEVSGLAGTGRMTWSSRRSSCPRRTVDSRRGPASYSTHFPRGCCNRYPFILASALPIGALALGVAHGAVETVMELAQTKQPAGLRRCCGSTRCFTSGWRKRWPWCAQRGRGSTPRCSRPGRPCGPRRGHRGRARGRTTRERPCDAQCRGGGRPRLHHGRGDANNRRSPLQRALRDIHAVTQHIATAPSQYESAGRMLWGCTPAIADPLVSAGDAERHAACSRQSSPHLSWQAGMRRTSARSRQARRLDSVSSTHCKGPRPRVCAAASCENEEHLIRRAGIRLCPSPLTPLSDKWLRVLQIPLTFCRIWRNLILQYAAISFR